MRIRDAVAELAEEHAELGSLLSGLDEAGWRAPTPAAGWDVRDQVSHLADTNEICVDTIAGGPRPLNPTAAAFPSPEAFTASGVELGRAMPAAEVLAWWIDSARANREALAALSDRDRVPWSLGMSAPMMATARLMETWAHGCDIRAAVGAPFSRSPRLRSIAFLTLRAVPYALSLAKVPQPEGTLRAELGYDDEMWRIGPDDATDVIAGDAFEFCRLGIRRIARDGTSLIAKGALAETALDNLRAFL